MSWTTPYDLRCTLKCIGKLAEVLSELGGPVTKEICDLLSAGRYAEVIDFTIDYSLPTLTYNDLVYARQAKALVEKQDFLDLGIDLEEVAWEKFKQSEEKCRLTNERLRSLDSGGTYPPGVASVMFYAQRKISEILGDLPDFGELEFSFGPGANTSMKAKLACARAKLSASLECSTNFAPFVRGFLAEFPMWTVAHSLPGMSDGNFLSSPVTIKVSTGKLQFVPKNAKTKRSIVVEPILNSFYQKGLGKYMKRRLRKFGVDLSDQTRNRALARKGSLDGSLCTVDITSASDCISRELVWNLFPLPWAQALDIGRTPYVTYRHQDLLLEKFSSMGNAYTFELESILFYSLSIGVCKALGLTTESVSAYGDDIIIPTPAYDLLLSTLEFCGFTVNSEKSYSFGPFRESCGADWFCGMDVRPFYLRKQISDRTLMVMHNFFVRHGEWRLAKIAKTFIKPHNRIYGPDGYGDGHLIGSYSLRSSRKLRRCGYEGGFFDTFVCLPKRVKTRYRNDWIFPSYTIYMRTGEEESTDPDIVRGTKGYRRASIYTLADRIFSAIEL